MSTLKQANVQLARRYRPKRHHMHDHPVRVTFAQCWLRDLLNTRLSPLSSLLVCTFSRPALQVSPQSLLSMAESHAELLMLPRSDALVKLEKQSSRST